jgi:hypothetical protein
VRRCTLALSAILLLFAGDGAARLVDGTEISETLNVEGTALVLNGAGVRTRFFLDVYVGGLYLEEPSAEAAAIIDADELMAIRLHVTSRLVSNERMRSSIALGFEKSTGGNTAPLRAEIDALSDVFRDDVAIADVFDLVYVPGKGLDLYKNGAHRTTVVCGMRFKRALFGIWLSERAVQASLRREMLGH